MANSKRAATSDLNHNNWDDEDEPESAGNFKTASDDILKNRVIKVAKRRTPLGSTTSTAANEFEKKSIFANFGGFTKAPSSTPFNFLSLPTTSTEQPKTNGLDLTNTTTTLVDSCTDQPEYYPKLKGLNQSVSIWIKKHVDTNPLINLTPIFRDYEKYFEEIERLNSTELEHKVEIESAQNAELPNTTAPFSNVQDTQTPTFSFRNTTSATNLLGSGGFKFGTAVSQPFTLINQTKPVDTRNSSDNESDEPPKVEFTPVVEEGHVYTVRCKVFVKKGDSYSEKGLGNLYLKPVPSSDKVQIIVRADTNLGLLLCNFILSNNIPIKRMGKKDVMLVCIPLPENKPPPVPVLLRVKSPEQADELLATLEKHRKL